MLEINSAQFHTSWSNHIGFVLHCIQCRVNSLILTQRFMIKWRCIFPWLFSGRHTNVDRRTFDQRACTYYNALPMQQPKNTNFLCYVFQHSCPYILTSLFVAFKKTAHICTSMSGAILLYSYHKPNAVHVSVHALEMNLFWSFEKESIFRRMVSTNIHKRAHAKRSRDILIGLERHQFAYFTPSWYTCFTIRWTSKIWRCL